MKKLLLILTLFFSVCLIVACGNKTVNLHTELQSNYLNDDYSTATNYATGEDELSRPQPVSLSWKGNSNTYIVEIKEKDSDVTSTYEVNTNTLDIYNLKVHTDYVWYVNGDKKGEFVTSNGPRNLYIDGITNVRDLGGYKIDGGYTNQGLLIRCSKLNDDNTGEVLITQKGINELKRLGIKTEIDLRVTTPGDDGLIEQGGISTSAVDGVNYVSFPMQSGGNYLQLNRKVLPELFAILANEENYPIMFHCSIGTDRTGVVAFLINALLGVSSEDLYRDYMFSNFGQIYRMRTPSAIDDYINRVTIDDKESLQTNVKNYLLNLGVKEEDINSLIRIMTK